MVNSKKKKTFYIISPPTENINFNINNFKTISKFIKITCLQLRPKYKDTWLNERFIEKKFNIFKSFCKKNNIKIIINDDIKIAKFLKADGVHLGQKDISCLKARKSLGSRFTIGISCNNSINLAEKAKKDGADYVAFGPVFRSKTKITKRSFLDTDFLKKIFKNCPLPFTLIGGINHDNISKINIYKEFNLALISSIWDYEFGPLASAKKYNFILNKGNNNEDYSQLT